MRGCAYLLPLIRQRPTAPMGKRAEALSLVEKNGFHRFAPNLPLFPPPDP